MVANTKKEREPLFHISKRTDIAAWKKWLVRIVALAVSLLIAGLVSAFLTDFSKFGDFFNYLFTGAVGTQWRIQVLFQNWAILMCISLAVTPAFKMKFWNIGAEGQTLIAALAAVTVIWYLGGKVAEPVLILIMFAASILAGAVWGVIPAIFKAFFGTNETLFTLMMNYIATHLVLFAVNAWATDGSAVLGVLDHGSFDGIFGLEYIQNVVFVTIVTVIMFVYLKYAKHGYELEVVQRQEGHHQDDDILGRALRLCGLPPRRRFHDAYRKRRPCGRQRIYGDTRVLARAVQPDSDDIRDAARRLPRARRGAGGKLDAFGRFERVRQYRGGNILPFNHSFGVLRELPHRIQEEGR